MSNSEFKDLIDAAKAKLRPREISPLIEAGGVAAAILTAEGNVYVGVCIDTACSLGMCAERNAVANMITNGESKIRKIACLTVAGGKRDPEAISPCGACQEFIMQLGDDAGDIEILTSINELESIKLRDVKVEWWGNKYKK